MAQDTTPALVLYVGNGTQTEFEVPFDKGSFGEIKVAFVRRGLTDYTYDPDTYNVKGYLYAWNGGVYTKTETPDTDTPLYDKDGEATGDMWEATMYREPKNDIFTKAYVEWTGDILTSDDVICIVRETTKDQPYSYPNNQKHIERALDNLSRQIQELQLTADNALKVDPSWNYTMDDERKMDPIAWLQTIVRSKGLTLRELRIDNNYIEYTTDDPDSLTKTWNVIAGVKTGNGGVVSHIRETKVLAEDGVTYIPYLEYSVDGGNSWTPAGRGQSELEHLYVKKSGDTMTGPLKFIGTNSRGAIYGEQSGVKVGLVEPNGETITTVGAWTSFGVVPANNVQKLGAPNYKWDTVFAAKLNNGNDLSVPAKSGTLATKDEVDLAANSGDQLTNKGVWYAKMYAATVAPAAEDGTNYADFSQVDTGNNPIIVLYERQNGAWVQGQTITPPADYNGYVTVTSKIWDIVEQDGQQGGQVLWAFNTKTFTPYPKIISFEDAHLTGTPTTPTPTGSSPDEQVANKGYVKSQALAAQTLSLNMEITGSLSGIYDGNLSGFSATNWVKIPGKIDLSGYHYDIDFSFTTGLTLSSSSQDIFFSVNNQGDLNLATDNSNEIQFCGNATGLVLAPNTKYYFRVTKDGPSLYLSYSPDGVVYTVIAQASSLTGANDYYGFNVNLDTNGESILHAKETKVTINNIIVWKAMDAPGLHTKVTKGHEVIAFQAPTAQNNYTWYRKYADGWVEQGGYIATSSDVEKTIGLAVKMADTYYNVNIQREYTSSPGSTIANLSAVCVWGIATNQFKCWDKYGTSVGIRWEVKGMAA